jgi:hypothetical protein
MVFLLALVEKAGMRPPAVNAMKPDVLSINPHSETRLALVCALAKM